MGIELQNSTVSEFKGGFYDQLKAIGQLAYGHGIGEGDKGGKGNIGLVGGKVIKFNTKFDERKNLDKSSAVYTDMKTHCDELRKLLYNMANDVGIGDDGTLLEKLGMMKDDASLIGGVKVKENAGLLERTNTADVLKMLFDAKHKIDTENQETLDGIWSGHRKTIGSSVAVFKTAVEEYVESSTNERTKMFSELVGKTLNEALACGLSADKIYNFVDKGISERMPEYVKQMNKWYGRVCDFLHGLKPKNTNDVTKFSKVSGQIEDSKENVETILAEIQRVVEAQAKLAPIVKLVKKIEKDIECENIDVNTRKANLERECEELKKMMAQGDFRDANGTVHDLSYWVRLLDPDEINRDHYQACGCDDLLGGGSFAEKLLEKGCEYLNNKNIRNGFSNMCGYVTHYFQIDELGYNSKTFKERFDDAYGKNGPTSISEMMSKGVNLMRSNVDGMIGRLKNTKFSEGATYPDFSTKDEKKFEESKGNLPENIKSVCDYIRSAVMSFNSAIDFFGDLPKTVNTEVETSLAKRRAKATLEERCQKFEEEDQPLLKEVLNAEEVEKIPTEKLRKLCTALRNMHNDVCREGDTDPVNIFHSQLNYMKRDYDENNITSLRDFEADLKDIIRAGWQSKDSIFYNSGNPSELGVPYKLLRVNREYFKSIREQSPDTNISKAVIDLTKPYFSNLHKLAQKFGVIDDYGRLK